jgi:DNA-binding transcriptional regulator YhcF (GntR family)
MPVCTEEPPPRLLKADRAPYPYDIIAGTLRETIESGGLPVAAFLPSLKVIAAEHAVAVGTAHRAVSLLVEWGHAEVVPGRGVRVVSHPPVSVVEEAPALMPAEPPAPAVDEAGPAARMLDFVIRRRGEHVTRFSACAVPGSADELRVVLVDAILRRGEDEARVAEYELELRHAGEHELMWTFVASGRRRP